MALMQQHSEKVTVPNEKGQGTIYHHQTNYGRVELGRHPLTHLHHCMMP